MVSKSEIRRSGQRLRDFRISGQSLADLTQEDAASIDMSYDVVSDFRASFAQPLLSIRMSLQSFARTLDMANDAFIAQRLKRLPRIIAKLERFPMMNVTTMGDIGGCRVVVPGLAALRTLEDHIVKTWRGNIRSVRDYVINPKPDGYRAVHIEVERSDRRIEVQLRTERQHTWADTVERFSRRSGVELKWGEGEAETNEFFRKLGEVIGYLDRGEVLPTELEQWLFEE